jgi:hypothetical protein
MVQFVPLQSGTYPAVAQMTLPGFFAVPQKVTVVQTPGLGQHVSDWEQ